MCEKDTEYFKNKAREFIKKYNHVSYWRSITLQLPPLNKKVLVKGNTHNGVGIGCLYLKNNDLSTR